MDLARGTNGAATAPAAGLAPRRVRVVHLIEGLGPGGAERLLYTNLKHLDGRRYHSTVVILFPGADHWLEPIRRLGVDVFNLGCRGYAGLPYAAARLGRLLRRLRPHLVHTHLWAANVVGRVAAFSGGVPVVSSVHCPEYEPAAAAAGTFLGFRKQGLALALDRCTARLACRRLIAVSEYVRRSAVRHLRFPLARTALLYNPIDVAEIGRPPGRGRSRLLADLGVPADSLLLLNVGRVAPEKGLLDAVRALPAIRSRHPNAHLVSVGATTDRDCVERVRSQAAAAGVADVVHILGPRRDVGDWLRACDIFLFPSRFEGLGIALLEAMAAGCVCVATDTGPMPEVVRHGVDGWLVPPGDPGALAEAVCRLLARPSLCQDLRNAARAAVGRFDPVDAARRLEHIYESVLTPGPRP